MFAGFSPETSVFLPVDLVEDEVRDLSRARQASLLNAVRATADQLKPHDLRTMWVLPDEEIQGTWILENGFKSRLNQRTNSLLLSCFTAKWDEAFAIKSKTGAFDDPELGAHLKAHGVSTIVLAGVNTHYCILETVRGALQQGFHVVVLHDMLADTSHNYNEFKIDRVNGHPPEWHKNSLVEALGPLGQNNPNLHFMRHDEFLGDLKNYPVRNLVQDSRYGPSLNPAQLYG